VSPRLPRWSAAIAATAILLCATVARADAPVAHPAPAAAAAAAAEARFYAVATQAGVISLLFFGAEGTPVVYYEHIGDRLVRLGTRAVAPEAPAVMQDAVAWRGDRLVRRFVAATVMPDGRQVARGYEIDRNGAKQECCGAGWVADYSRRVRSMMKAYRRHGRARVVWLTLPIPRGARAWTDAVNAAIVRAAQGLDRVTVLRLDLVFAPDGFREVMPYRGRDVRARVSDGIHMTLSGSAIAAKLVAVALRRR